MARMQSESKFLPQNDKLYLIIGTAVLILVLAILFLYSQGRHWICTCGQVHLWAGDVWSADNSQHIFDPYTPTHILHGFLFLASLWFIRDYVSLGWRFIIALSLESLWEVFENSTVMIERYRQTTISIGYTGDTIINSVADIASFGIGFWLAHYLGWRKALAVFILTEVILIFWIRDSLLLNITMLLYPIDAIRTWQSS